MPKSKKPAKPAASEEKTVVESHGQPALSRFIEAVRVAVGAALDLADAAADALTKNLQARP